MSRATVRESIVRRVVAGAVGRRLLLVEQAGAGNRRPAARQPAAMHLELLAAAGDDALLGCIAGGREAAIFSQTAASEQPASLCVAAGRHGSGERAGCQPQFADGANSPGVGQCRDPAGHRSAGRQSAGHGRRTSGRRLHDPADRDAADRHGTGGTVAAAAAVGATKLAPQFAVLPAAPPSAEPIPAPHPRRLEVPPELPGANAPQIRLPPLDRQHARGAGCGRRQAVSAAAAARSGISRRRAAARKATHALRPRADRPAIQPNDSPGRGRRSQRRRGDDPSRTVSQSHRRLRRRRDRRRPDRRPAGRLLRSNDQNRRQTAIG